MKKTKWALTLLFVIGSLWMAFAQTEEQHSSKDIYDNLDIFANGLAIIQRDYVDEVEPQKLIYGALKGMLKALDPHSQFLDPEAYREMQGETEGKFGGLGIEITTKDNYLTVVTAIEGTPAYQVGIMPKDRIVKIDGSSTKDLGLEEAVKKLRGEPGTKVKLTVLRESEKDLLDFEIERAIIKIESITRAEMIDNVIGYVRISEFQERTGDDLAKALKDFESKGMKGVILDVRNNPGGLLQASVDVVEKFVESGSLVVYTKGRKPSQNLSFKAKGGPMTQVPLVVLVNEGSASASEIVAGAVQDLKRGVAIGKKTFGKGSVQSVIPLKDGSALKLTTSKYFTPNGRSIQGKGIEPDLEITLPPKKASKKKNTPSPSQPTEKKEIERDEQLQAAIDFIMGRRVISPKTEVTSTAS